jgi:hypothetical protein
MAVETTGVEPEWNAVTLEMVLGSGEAAELVGAAE